MVLNEGKKEGNFITLEQAMHTTNIAKPEKGNTPSSCVSCHEAQLAKRDCAGCHKVVTPARDAQWCGVCHKVDVTPAQMKAGASGKLTGSENLALATRTVQSTKPVAAPSSLGPTKVTIDAIAKEYKPCVFNHRRHIESLMDRIKDNKLAGAFHTQPETVCAVCHHNSPLSVTPPKCSSCHQTTIDPNKTDRPALKAAYHLQCMGCHTGMNVARPENTDCTGCHKSLDK